MSNHDVMRYAPFTVETKPADWPTDYVAAADYDALASNRQELWLRWEAASDEALDSRIRIRALEAALDWALRHGAYTDRSESGFVYVSTDGHRKRLPPFPPLIPELEAARARVCAEEER